ncbi:unnamed protein product [Leuciscus chuanchicus]
MIIDFYLNVIVKISVMEGDSVTLNSDLTEMKDDDVIQWRIGNESTVIAEINKRVDRITVYDDVLDGRFRDRLKLDNQTGSLTITNTRTEHEGDYKLLMLSGRLSSKSFRVSVYARLPVPVISSNSSHCSSSSSSSCSLVCSSVVNVSHVTLSWYKGISVLSSISASDLSISLSLPLEVEYQDKNPYSCVLNNPISNQTTHLDINTLCHTCAGKNLSTCSGLQESRVALCGVTENPRSRRPGVRGARKVDRAQGGPAGATSVHFSPAAHWSSLEAWLAAMTSGCLSKDFGDPKLLTQQELDANVDQIMSQDPTQAYNSKEWSRLIGSLSHYLVSQARLLEEDKAQLEKDKTQLEKDKAKLEKDTAGLKTQLKEACKQKELAQQQLDELLLETEEETHPEPQQEVERLQQEVEGLQQEVERLQQALEDLRLDTDRTVEAEKQTTAALNSKLLRGEDLLARARTELTDRDARVKVCETFLQKARAEIDELIQQRHELKGELDLVHCELKHVYDLQDRREGETHTTPSLLTREPALHSRTFKAKEEEESPRPDTTSPAGPVPERRATSHRTASKELDKLARNIPTFNPNPAGGNDVHSYLTDIEFHLQTVDNVTTWDKLYLLRITSGRIVRSFLDRQPESVKTNYPQLRQALIREFSDPESDQGILAAMDLKQARLETPQAYYERLRLAYFGPRNEAHMEEDVSFKTLFLRNLHPSQSAHLGVLVCPRTLSIQQLRDLAHKAYVKQKTVSEKPVKYPTVCAVSASGPELALEGAQPANYEPGNKQSRPFQAGRGQRNRGVVRPRPQNDRFGGSWDRHRFPHNQKGGGSWEADQHPRKGRPRSPRTASPDKRPRDPPRHDDGKTKVEPTSDRNSAATPEEAELLRALIKLVQRKPHKEDKDKPDTA